MNLTEYNRKNLLSIHALLQSLNDEQFREPLPVLSGSSIGAHVRHILEFYICLLRANSDSPVCYDKRERNHRIETERLFALVIIDNVIAKLMDIKSDHRIVLRSDFSENGNDAKELDSSLFRELAYCLEHSIHHEALIKIGVNSMCDDAVMIESFGVAPSTLRKANK